MLFIVMNSDDIIAFISELGGGGVMDLVYGQSFLPPTWPVLCFSVMSDLNLDDPGFRSPGAPTPAPPSSGSSSDTATD